VRYDEVFEQQEIRHAIRFTASITRRAYVAPARHWASSNTSVGRPPMGMRVRLKASVDISGYSPPRWNDNELNTLKGIKGSNFEVVRMENIVTP